MENKSYILNKETGKIELHFEKSEYDALTPEQKSKLSSAFLWSRTARAWVSRAKVPNLYRPRQIANELGFTEEECVGERLSYAEQLQRKTERAEARAERYEQYAENAEKRGADLQSGLNSMMGDIAFYTQPIIPGHAGSETFGRWRRRLYDRFDKGMEEYRKSEYFRSKAETASKTAAYTKLKDKTYLNNRIKECTASIKKIRSNIEHYENILKALEDPESSESKSGTYSAEKVGLWIRDALEYLEMEIDKLGFFENCLDEVGGVQFSKENIRPGYIVKIRRSEFKVLKANPKTVMARCMVTNMVLTYDYAEIQEIISAVEEKNKKENGTHPYQKGDILIGRSLVGNRIIEAYQVISVTDKTVQMRQLTLSETHKPVRDSFADGSEVIRKKPYISRFTEQWGILGEYGRTLEKYMENEVEAV